jgi:hypothetical protein
MFLFSYSKLLSLRIYDLPYLKNREECLAVLKLNLLDCNVEIGRKPRHYCEQAEQLPK